MYDIRQEVPRKWAAASRFRQEPGGVCRDLDDASPACFRVALSFTTEAGEGQYPLEDVLERFNVYASDFLDSPSEPWAAGTRVAWEFAGDEDEVRALTSIVGKRVSNEDYVKDGLELVRLVIE